MTMTAAYTEQEIEAGLRAFRLWNTDGEPASGVYRVAWADVDVWFPRIGRSPDRATWPKQGVRKDEVLAEIAALPRK